MLLTQNTFCLNISFQESYCRSSRVFMTYLLSAIMCHGVVIAVSVFIPCFLQAMISLSHGKMKEFCQEGFSIKTRTKISNFSISNCTSLLTSFLLAASPSLCVTHASIYVSIPELPFLGAFLCHSTHSFLLIAWEDFGEQTRQTTSLPLVTKQVSQGLVLLRMPSVESVPVFHLHVQRQCFVLSYPSILPLGLPPVCVSHGQVHLQRSLLIFPTEVVSWRVEGQTLTSCWMDIWLLSSKSKQRNSGRMRFLWVLCPIKCEIMFWCLGKTKWTHGIILNFATIAYIAEHTQRKPAYCNALCWLSWRKSEGLCECVCLWHAVMTYGHLAGVLSRL